MIAIAMQSEKLSVNHYRTVKLGIWAGRGMGMRHMQWTAYKDLQRVQGRGDVTWMTAKESTKAAKPLIPP